MYHVWFMLPVMWEKNLHADMLLSYMFFPLEVSKPKGTYIFGHQFKKCGIHGSVIQKVEIMGHTVVGRFKKNCCILEDQVVKRVSPHLSCELKLMICWRRRSKDERGEERG